MQKCVLLWVGWGWPPGCQRLADSLSGSWDGRSLQEGGPVSPKAEKGQADG